MDANKSPAGILICFQKALEDLPQHSYCSTPVSVRLHDVTKKHEHEPESQSVSLVSKTAFKVIFHLKVASEPKLEAVVNSL